MDPSTAAGPALAGPHAEYRNRLAAFRTEQQRLERRLAWLGNTRFVLFVLTFVVVGLTFFAALASPFWVLLPVALFVGLSLPFFRAARRSRYVGRAIGYYEYGLARLEDRWIGGGVPGTNYLDEGHLYAADLDLFGRGSLFERLCDARTRIGRDTLARWLSAPAPPAEIVARQQALRDLRDRLGWREQLALYGSDVPEGIDTAALATWGETPVPERSPWPRHVAPLFVLFTVFTLVSWLDGTLPVFWLLAALLLQGGFALWLTPRVRAALDGVHGRARDLFYLSSILKVAEGETFTAPRLIELQQNLSASGELPSARLARLLRFMEMLESKHNSYLGLILPLFLWATQIGLALEVWRRQTGPALGRWLLVVGELEALSSLASYAYENPSDPFPEVVPEGPLFDAVGLGHPLLPRAQCVSNDLRLDKRPRLLVVSGSNMSGKSTFLRTVGVNAVLALAGAPVRAARLRLSPLAIGATLRIQDSLMAGKSRFYAEITRLRRIVELAQGPLPVLFLLDEILHGTNSHDRRIGAEAVLRTLLQHPSIGLVTTHDLALTEIAEDLAPLAVNVHFADEMANGELHFDYRLRPGVVRHSNALALMRAVGLRVEGGEGEH